MQIEINPEVLKELEYLVELHQAHGAANPMPSVERLVGYVLASVADGSRRPGAWERELLNMMGLVADCDEHYTYRPHYGKPEAE
ncbi:MAG: hypothetical protein ACNA7M_13360 [Roseovarius sp.]